MLAGVHQVVTFASQSFRGNPAFVLMVERPVPDSLLSQVAAEFREPVLPSLRLLSRERAELLFHTPEGEHRGAGHAAAAAAHVLLAQSGGPEATLVFKDHSERVIKREGTRISVPWPAMPSKRIDKIGELSAALRTEVAEAWDSDFGYVAVCDSEASVETVLPDLDAIARLDRRTVTITAPGARSDIVIRVFAPKLGLPEDPVCGTAHRIITPYWCRRLGQKELHSRQLSPRGGDLWCSLDGTEVVISGESRLFLKGSVELPDA